VHAGGHPGCYDGNGDVPFIPLLLVYSVQMTIGAGIFVHSMSHARHQAREHLQLQSWQLRQLMPG